MRTVIAAPTHTMASFANQELVAIANCLNEILHNSNIDDRDCETRIGTDLKRLRVLHAEISDSLNRERAASTELFEAWKDGFSIQLRAISAFGDPADLSYDEVKATIGNLRSEVDE